MKIAVISAVRDFAMYDTCVASNPQWCGAARMPLDNRAKNEPIPVLYNRFLDTYDYAEPAWFVFCHEDFQPLEPLAPHLEGADPASLWGPIGVTKVWRWGFDPHFKILGRIVQCEKDGSDPRTYGEVSPHGARSETFDCQCVIVHSSLVAKHGLRFDPRFPFDLYVEDFCVAAREQFGIASRILPFACRHWSAGALTERYETARRVFAGKWPTVCTTGTSSEILGGGASAYRRSMVYLKLLKRSLLSRLKRRLGGDA